MSNRKELPKKISASQSLPQPVREEGELKHLLDRFKSGNSNSHGLINEIEIKLNELWRYEGDGAVEGEEARKESLDLLSRFKSEIEVQEYINIRLEKVIKFLRETI